MKGGAPGEKMTTIRRNFFNKRYAYALKPKY